MNIVLKEGFSTFLQTADEGSIKRHFEAQGFVFTNRSIRYNIIANVNFDSNDNQTNQSLSNETNNSFDDKEMNLGGLSLPIFLLIGVIIIFVAVIVMRNR